MGFSGGDGRSRFSELKVRIMAPPVEYGKEGAPISSQVGRTNGNSRALKACEAGPAVTAHAISTL
ncbi:hypothetical protein EYF80_054377 [Liparis tanakae]|uniref:Uncharacterized protein n=1 Tax=Liparis tanakae TaxID=230148 RepID=A0A4Z2F3J9_9TELE|nr:hypothetical protein EYF80_054377 [Liparis tanakae]